MRVVPADLLSTLTDVVVVLGAFGLWRHVECSHPGCHRFALPRRSYCLKHIEDER